MLEREEPGMGDRAMEPLVLHYHRVSQGPILAGGWVLPRQLRFHLSQLARWGFSPADPSEFPALSSERTYLLTFDDAYTDVAENALPVMEDFGARGMVFPVTGFLGRKPTWDVTWGTSGRHMDRAQLRELASGGWEIGSHSVTHPDLRRLDDRTLGAELLDSKKTLEDITGAGVFCFSYPFGRFNTRVRDAVAAAGYRVAFTMRRGPGLGWTDPLAIPRVSIYLPDYSLYRKIEPAYRWPEAFLERLINLNAGGTAWVRHRAPWLGRLLGMKPDD